MAAITLSAITKRFGSFDALQPLSLEVQDREFVALLGPSGCGKTTTLNILAGLEAPTSGRILIDGRDVTDIPPMQRNLAMVFQSYALYPHLSVRRNIAFPLEVRRAPRAEIDSAVARAAELLEITPYLDRYPRALSGGQRQRVALGRALVRKPAAFLLDEPLSNLDAVLRLQMRAELSGLFRSLGATALYVTHDQAEAMTMADRIAVFAAGRMLQFAPPLTIYRAPADRAVAAFVGAPPMMFLDGIVTDGGAIQAGGLTFPARHAPLAPGAAVTLGLRPEDVSPARDGPTAEVVLVEHYGGNQVVTLRAGPARFCMLSPPDMRIEQGHRIGVSVDPRNLYLFAPDTGRTLAAPGLDPRNETR
ncbi:MAG: ABC transporter ATP-binding protein [Rubellimicrobium sp.]|nr:ABC transporter ATP-binding protein [Rubellimicrobium sp.]